MFKVHSGWTLAGAVLLVILFIDILQKEQNANQLLTTGTGAVQAIVKDLVITS